MATPPVTLESLDIKVDELATDLRAEMQGIREVVQDRVHDLINTAADRAADRVAETLRPAIVGDLDLTADTRHAHAMKLARDNHGALIRKLTETVDAFASRSEVESLRKEVATLRAMVEDLKAKLEARP